MKGPRKKICWQKTSIMVNEICINEEMLLIYIYILPLSEFEHSGEGINGCHLCNAKLFE